MSIGTRISDMTALAAAGLTADAMVPVVQDGENYGFQLKDEFDRYPTSVALAASGGASLIGFDHSSSSVVGSIADWIGKLRGIDITQPPYNADNTGATDVGAIILQAATDNPGRFLYAPMGDYLIVTPVLQRLTAAVGATFAPALKLFGDGEFITRFIVACAGASAIDIDTAAHTGDIAYAPHISDCSFSLQGGTANASAITLRNCRNPTIENVYIRGMSGSGIRLITTIGDLDANNRSGIRNVDVLDCAVWGIDNPGGSGSGGANEGSYLRVDDVIVQNCGTNDGASVPTSGGIRWKGQALLGGNVACVLNYNVGFYVPQDGKTAQALNITNLTLENNRKRGLYVRDGYNFKIDGIQVYQNDTYRGTVGVEFDASVGIAQNIAITQPVVRVSHEQPYDAFVLGGANVDYTNCRIDPPKWLDFDHLSTGTGQRRFVGWRFPTVRQCGILVATSTAQLTFQQNPAASPGHTTPLRMSGPLIDGGSPYTGTASTSGEWIAKDFGSGVALANTTQTLESATPSTTSGIGGGPIHNVYLFDVSNVLTLRLSNVANVTDSVTGYPVKTGDATKLFVGRAEIDGAGLFKVTAGGYLNPMLLTRTQVGSFGRLWFDANDKLIIKGSATEASADTDGSKIPIQAAAQIDSVAATVADLKTDFNALLAKLRTSGAIAP